MLRSLARPPTEVAGDPKAALPAADSSRPLSSPDVPSEGEEGDAGCGRARRRLGAQARAPLSRSPGGAAEPRAALVERGGCGRRGQARRQGALLVPERRPARSGGEPGTSWSFGKARVVRKGTLGAGGRLLSLWCDRSSCPRRDSVFLKRGCSERRGLPLPFRSPPLALGPPALGARQSSAATDVHPCRRAGCQQRGLNVAPAALRDVFLDRALWKAAPDV